MDLGEHVKSWIDWSRENLSDARELPQINWGDPTSPWLEDFSDSISIAVNEGERILACLVGELASDPANIPARFTALNFFSALACHITMEDFICRDEICMWFAKQMGFDEQEWEMGEAGVDAELEEMARRVSRKTDKLIEQFHQDLCAIVRLLKVEDVPNDWRLVRWEILNSYLISDWDRATKLYNKAEDFACLERTTLQMLRGQFRFLMVCGRDIDIGLETLWWEPKVYGQDEPEKSMVLLISGLGSNRSTHPLSNQDLNVLRDAINDLEKALSNKPDSLPVYRSILARCYFLTGHLQDAAKQYDQMLLVEAFEKVPKLKMSLYETLAKVHHAADDPQREIEVLEQWADDFPREKGIYLQIAELQAREANNEAVVEAIRQEVERNPDMDRDWKTSTIVALGETREASERFLKELKSNPRFYGLIEQVMSEYWPPFRKLIPAARERWIHGTALQGSLPTDRLRVPQLRDAAAAFTEVVEVELRERVFRTYRNHVRQSPDLLKIAKREFQTEPNDAFSKFLIEEDVPFALGQMLYVLNPENFTGKPILQGFSDWVQLKYGSLGSHFPDLLKINKFRREKTHVKVPSVDVEEIPRLCRKVIEALTC